MMIDLVQSMFYGVCMDTPHYRSRTYAIEHNRQRLLAVVADLLAMIGLTAAAWSREFRSRSTGRCEGSSSRLNPASDD